MISIWFKLHRTFFDKSQNFFKGNRNCAPRQDTDPMAALISCRARRQDK